MSIVDHTIITANLKKSIILYSNGNGPVDRKYNIERLNRTHLMCICGSACKRRQQAFCNDLSTLNPIPIKMEK